VESPRLERLTRAECRLLLPSALVGRLAVPMPNFPTLEPVSFALVDDDVVVAVRSGSAADAVAPGTVLTFEADVVDHSLRSGWSVVVKGPVEDLADDAVPGIVSQLHPWPAGDGDRFLRIRAERVTGQRVVSADGAPPVSIEVPGRSAASPSARRAVDSVEAFGLLERGGQHVGRLAITVAGEPLVFPLNYAVDGDAVVFRTRVGTKLTGITRSLATFEVDDIDASGVGWSVEFEGLAQEVLDSDPAGLRSRLAAIDLETWPGGDRAHMVRITPFRVHATIWTAAVRPTVPAVGSASAS
jgi:nitroimidazol reductase NimA-like FMN-containing flavoprotein (pyridoxamine 5'-phosphate oxidase superfamily)